MTKQDSGDLIISFTDDFYRIAKAILKEDADCEDAMSSAIVKGFSKLHTLKKQEYAKTWFSRILINECSSVLRCRKRMEPFDEQTAENIAAPEHADHSELYDAITALEEKHRLPVVLYYLEGFRTREIAAMLGVPEGTVKSRLRAARERLRQDLKGECFV